MIELTGVGSEVGMGRYTTGISWVRIGRAGLDGWIWGIGGLSLFLLLHVSSGSHLFIIFPPFIPFHFVCLYQSSLFFAGGFIFHFVQLYPFFTGSDTSIIITTKVLRE